MCSSLLCKPLSEGNAYVSADLFQIVIVKVLGQKSHEIVKSVTLKTVFTYAFLHERKVRLTSPFYLEKILRAIIASIPKRISSVNFCGKEIAPIAPILFFIVLKELLKLLSIVFLPRIHSNENKI